METLTDQVIKGSFWGGLASLLTKIGALIFTVILARFLLPENFGLYSLTMSIAAIFMIFADLGLNQTLVKFASTYKDKKKIAAYSYYIFKLKFILSFAVFLVLLLLSYPLSFYIYKNVSLFFPLIFSSFFIFTSLFVNFFSSFFYVIKKVKYIFGREIIFQITRIILIVLIFFFFASSYYVLGVIVGLIITNVFVIILLYFWLKKEMPCIFRRTKEKIDKIRLMKFVGYSFIASISGIFFTYIDMIMLGFFVSLSYVGYYRAAFTLIFGTVGLFTYLGTLLLPYFVQLHKKRLKRAFNKVLRIVSIFSFPAAFGLLALGRYFIRLLYGYSYLPASYPFYLLSLLLISWPISTLLSALFFSKEKPKNVAKIITLALLINITLNYIFISRLVKISELYAIIGAAFATVISRYFLLLMVSESAKKNLKISLKKQFFIKPIFASLIMFFFMYLFNMFLIRNMTLLIGIGEILFGAFIYLVIMFFIKGITKQDLELLKYIPLRSYKSGK